MEGTSSRMSVPLNETEQLGCAIRLAARDRIETLKTADSGELVRFLRLLFKIQGRAM